MKNNNKAFTPAEVLITLGIIGIIAAMTLPSLIQKQQKKMAANQLKVMYSKLYNAIKMAEVHEGEAKYWQYFDENLSVSDNSWNWANRYLVPYFKKLNVYRDSRLHGCKNITYKKIDGTVRDCNSVISFCETCGAASMGNMTQIHLVDGTIVIVMVRKTSTDTQVEIDIDTNGYKGPNTWGKDIFRLQMDSQTQYRLLGGPYYGIKRDTALRQCINEKGVFSCAAVIMGDGWEIKDDYPW